MAHDRIQFVITGSLLDSDLGLLLLGGPGSIRRRLMATTHQLGARMPQPSHQFDRPGLQLLLQVSSLN
jgi:hypothetical protein